MKKEEFSHSVLLRFSMLSDFSLSPPYIIGYNSDNKLSKKAAIRHTSENQTVTAGSL